MTYTSFPTRKTTDWKKIIEELLKHKGKAITIEGDRSSLNHQRANFLQATTNAGYNGKTTIVDGKLYLALKD